jgi:hypothetical protein
MQEKKIGAAQIKQIQLFLAEFCVMLLSYGLFLTGKYFSVDSYGLYYGIDLKSPLSSKRYIWYIGNRLLKALNFNPVVHEHFFALFLMLVFAWAAQKVAAIWLRAVPDAGRVLRATILVAATLCFCNVYFWEWFTFPEAVLGYVASIIFAVKATEVLCGSRSVKSCVCATVLVMLAMFSYQIAMPLFVIWCITEILLRYRLKLGKQAWGEIARVLFVGALGSVLSIVAAKIIELLRGVDVASARGSASITQIVQTAVTMFKMQRTIWLDGSNFLPPALLLAALGFAAVLILWHYRGRYRAMWGAFAAGVILYGMVFVPLVMAGSASCAPRTIVGWFSFWAALWLTLAIAWQDNKKAEWSILLFATVFLAVNIVNIWGATEMQFTANGEDETYSWQVENEIRNYEAATQEKVTSIYFAVDENATWIHTDRGYKYSFCGTNVCAAPVSWALGPMIRYYTGSEYTTVEMDESEKQLYFGDADFNEFDAQTQMCFVGDSCYLLVY